MTEPLIEPHRYRVVVEVPVPREDWLTRLMEYGRHGCSRCGGKLPDVPIYLNTEGKEGDSSAGEEYCSWACVLENAASVIAVTDEEYGPLVSVSEIQDWRA